MTNNKWVLAALKIAATSERQHTQKHTHTQTLAEDLTQHNFPVLLGEDYLFFNCVPVCAVCACVFVQGASIRHVRAQAYMIWDARRIPTRRTRQDIEVVAAFDIFERLRRIARVRIARARLCANMCVCTRCAKYCVCCRMAVLIIIQGTPAFFLSLHFNVEYTANACCLVVHIRRRRVRPLCNPIFN